MSVTASGRPTFGQRFVERAKAFGPVCVGIDPHESLLRDWGLPVSAAGVEKFSAICVEAFADVACVVKPQVAFYERFGSAGFAALERTIQQLREAGVLVIADAKRGDIGSTMAGYAAAWLSDDSPLCCDAVTVSPWLGFGSLAPVIELAESTGRGAIVLAATSNPEAPDVQRAEVPHQTTAGSHGPITLAQSIVDQVAEANAVHDGTGNLGVVVGATVEQPPRLDTVGGVILMPGVGAQGGTVDDVKRIAGHSAGLVSPNVSRAVLSAGPDVEAMRKSIEVTTANMLK
ncbi:MAG TPA: orotidine-5'-phosphate decarboxylase [Candidatus Corynebacterium gallistercoris]|uniref:Orotidine 5'-phosphate decarboxylase n=1 Tax=Candidatus Corynebacterium gallistercoris TaxID=2838530 RepID=A0A9D1RX17_9CORY|nr:orotidine-5'-phosphate decarboxylase [Candidatus Corynebacterium gallistercoris]